MNVPRLVMEQFQKTQAEMCRTLQIFVRQESVEKLMFDRFTHMQTQFGEKIAFLESKVDICAQRNFSPPPGEAMGGQELRHAVNTLVQDVPHLQNMLQVQISKQELIIRSLEKKIQALEIREQGVHRERAIPSSGNPSADVPSSSSQIVSGFPAMPVVPPQTQMCLQGHGPSQGSCGDRQAALSSTVAQTAPEVWLRCCRFLKL